MNAVNPPPFTLPDTFAGGIMWPEPSAKADAGFVNYAYTLNTEINVLSDHDVLTLIADDPVDTPEGTRAKFTKPGVALTVRDDAMVAAKATGPTGELT